MDRDIQLSQSLDITNDNVTGLAMSFLVSSDNKFEHLFSECYKLRTTGELHVRDGKEGLCQSDCDAIVFRQHVLTDTRSSNKVWCGCFWRRIHVVHVSAADRSLQCRHMLILEDVKANAES